MDKTPPVKMTDEYLVSKLRLVPDYPVKGIVFFDVTNLFKDPECLEEIVSRTAALYRDRGITKVAGIESRGFVVAAAVASRLGAGFVPIRKPGKLPFETVSERYEKEYGTDTLEMHCDAIGPDDVVLVHDDILATGGSSAAAIALVRRFSPRAVYANFIIEIVDCPKVATLPEDVEVTSLLRLGER